MKVKLLLYPCALVFLQLLFFTAFAQDRTVSGSVNSTTGQPLSGATVAAKGTNATTSTDNAGNFKFTVPQSTRVLVISYVGHANQEIAIPNSGVVAIQLEATISKLDEVVVVGYGAQRKSVVTGAISKVSAADLENQPVVRIEQSLQGRTSGLTVSSSSGQPGAASTVRLRGFTSF